MSAPIIIACCAIKSEAREEAIAILQAKIDECEAEQALAKTEQPYDAEEGVDGTCRMCEQIRAFIVAIRALGEERA